MSDQVAASADSTAELSRLRRSVELLRNEADLMRQLSSASNVDNLLEDILIHIRQRWGFDAVGIQLVDAQRHVLRGYRTFGPVLDEAAQAMVWRDVPLDSRASVSAWVALRQQSLYIHPALTQGRRTSAIDRQAVAALGLVESFIMPIVADGQTIGVVHFGVRQQRSPLNQQQLDEVRQFVLGMTAPIRGVVSREALERSRQEQAELAHLCQRISTSIELDRLLAVLGEQILADELFDGYFVSLSDAREEALTCRYIKLPAEFAGLESAYNDWRQPLTAASALTTAYREGRQLVVPRSELRRWPDLRHHFQRWRIETVALLPIRLEQRTIGVVFAFRQRRGLNLERLQTLQQRLPLFSEQIRNALFYSDLRRREAKIEHAAAERLRFLDVINRLIELTDTEQIYQLITQELLRWLPFDLAGIVLREDDLLDVKHISVRDPGLEPLRHAWQGFYRQRPFRLDPADGATAFAYLNDTRVLIPDVEQVLHLPMSHSDREALALMGTPRTFLFLPIRRQRRAIGVLWLISVRGPVALPERTIQLIEALCAVIGTAIGNAELYATVETQRREIETALAELRETQTQLAAAKAAAEASAASKSAFVANTSHEIRTPLTAIIGFAETLSAQAGGNSQVDRAATTILRNGRHLLGLIDDILDLSRIEAGRLDFEQTAYAPAALLQEVVAAMAPLAREKGLYFRAHASSPIPDQAQGDPARLRQALYNLCSNAIKFTQRGGVDIEIACDTAAERLHIRVRDTGIGIAPQHQQTLFQPFTQVEESSNRRYGGTGLGLAITRLLIEGLGGAVSVSSALAAGSTFELTIPTGPLAGVALHQPRLDAESSLVETAAPVRSRICLSGRVLVAEDSQDTQALVQHYLHELGLQSVLVENGEQAVRAALSTRMDLLLLDIQMPEMSGLEALTTLRACGYDRPVVALTANVMAADTQRYRQAGFDACLGKPIDRDEFLRVLQSYLPRSNEPSRQAERLDIGALAERFAEQLPERLSQMRQSLYAGDWRQLATEAHKLKGTAGAFGWPDLGYIAAHIETLLRTTPDDTARRQALEDALRRAGGLLRQA